MEKISGLLLFLRLAWPCKKGKLKTRKITPDDSEHLDSLVYNHRAPTIHFLEKCFHSAVNDYRGSCEKDGYDADFSFDSVLNHWRYHHNNNHYGDCATTEPTIVDISKNIKVIVGSRMIKVKNPYNLELQVGDTILVHMRTIALVL